MSNTYQPYQSALKVILFIALGCSFAFVILNFPKLQDRTADSSEISFVKLPNSEPTTREMLGAHKVGGLGESRIKDDTVVEVVQKIKPLFEEKTGKQYKELDVLEYKTQVVAGTNYFVKAKAVTSDDVEQIVHLRIYKDLQKELELTSFQLDKKHDDEIVHFE